MDEENKNQILKKKDASILDYFHFMKKTNENDKDDEKMRNNLDSDEDAMDLNEWINSIKYLNSFCLKN